MSFDYQFTTAKTPEGIKQLGYATAMKVVYWDDANSVAKSQDLCVGPNATRCAATTEVQELFEMTTGATDSWYQLDVPIFSGWMNACVATATLHITTSNVQDITTSNVQDTTTSKVQDTTTCNLDGRVGLQTVLCVTVNGEGNVPSGQFMAGSTNVVTTNCKIATDSNNSLACTFTSKQSQATE
jgi:hypothetical protein